MIYFNQQISLEFIDLELIKFITKIHSESKAQIIISLSDFWVFRGKAGVVVVLPDRLPDGNPVSVVHLF
jgi:hypothetical protein